MTNLPKLLYLPVINSSRKLFSRKLISNLTGEELITNFWTKGKSPFYYPYALISSFYGLDWFNYREEFNLPEEMFLYSDSGGFQAVMLDYANVNPLAVVSWQQKNSECGSILDVPPYEKLGTAQFGGNINKLFDVNLEKTQKNVDMMLKNWTNKKFELQSVVQGETPEQMIKWHTGMEKVARDNNIEFAGYAMSPKPANDPYKIALHGLLASRVAKDKPIHFLQATGGNALITIVYFNKLLKNRITVDSSTFSYGSRYGLFFDLYESFERKIHIGRVAEGREEIHANFDELPCNCIVCRHQIGKKIKQFEKCDWDFVNLHNICQTVNFVKYWDELATDRDYFMKRIGKERPELLKVFAMIDYGMKEGIEKAYDKYKNVISVTEQYHKSSNLMRFANKGTSEAVIPQVNVKTDEVNENV